VGELLLQLAEVRVRLQLRVVLADRQQPAQRLGDLVLRVGELTRLGDLQRLGTGLGDGLEGLALVAGVALDRVHQVGDEVVAALQLGVDLGPGLVDAHP
jgi:hypothetical protein